MKQLLKKIGRSNYTLYTCMSRTMLKLRKLRSTGNIVVNHGCTRLVKDFIGSGNKVVIGRRTIMNKTKIRIRGNNNTIIFGENIGVGKKCSFWLEGNNINVMIGNNTTFTHTVHFCVQEDDMYVIVGEGCMFSNHITVRTSDGHPIYDIDGNRINPPKPVKIGKNVWIAPDSKIMKGADIGDGAIIGSDSMVGLTPIPANTLAVGHPAKVVKEIIHWTREQLFPQ